MHLILTHEQGDFDAIAALFGAALVSAGAQPILPRRMNRNVRAFITLYGTEFPFLDPRDLPAETIESATLVDTQSLVTLKGMGKRTAVQVVDHHPHRRGTPSAWNVKTVDLGATTTYFVEALEERASTLSPIQATLLLLGIYEDTGTLTYARTTARDVRAAAWLLDQGADLQLAANFLNPPLTSEQRKTYDRLVANAETHDIHGHRVVLACGEVTDLAEEISTLAHKLRDLFDPDALFVIVQTLEGVRIVARSTTDRIDVSAITEHFGGGGHDRAAAALIRVDEDKKDSKQTVYKKASLLVRTREEVLNILPQHVKPSVTVAQIMSRRPHTLAPETSLAESARLMTRYGYEGFPVVDKGKVVGLLTRRSVDRALSHKLNLNAASLMDAGAVTVLAADSLQHLQTVMTDSGWGQIPVVDDIGKVIGIVTRTDVLKNLTRRAPRDKGHRTLASRLEKALHPGASNMLRAIADEAAAQHLPAYIVGGFVRDLLLNQPGFDFDIVVEGEAIALAKSLQQNFGGRVTSHSRFHTAKWFIEKSKFDGGALPDFIDLISSRQEFYEHPTALPTVEGGSIKLDLHRRDFTINTLALRLDGHHFGELHDYFGGQPDLEHGLVRVLHSLSFVDDPTRMLRAVRYEQRYGFTIEPRTLQLMDEARPLIARLSAERVRHELDLIFAESKCAAMLNRLHELNLLKAIADVLPWSADLHSRLSAGFEHSPPPAWGLGGPVAGIPFSELLGYTLWLLDLAPATLDALQARLRFPIATLKTMHAAVTLRAELSSRSDSKPSALTARLDELPLISVYAVYLVTHEPALAQYATEWRHVKTKTTGHTLKKLGLAPGPQYQQILSTLRAARLDRDLKSDKEEKVLLEKLLKSSK